MKIFIIENESSICPLLKSDDYRKGKDRIVCLNWLAFILMRRAGKEHNYVFGDNLLSASDLKELQVQVDKIAFGWFKPNGHDKTIVEGISVGELAVGVLARRYFGGVILKYGEIIRQAVVAWPEVKSIVHDLEGPGISIHQWADEYGETFDKARLVNIVASQLGIPAVFRAPPNSLPSASVSYRARISKSNSRGIRQLLKFGYSFFLKNISKLIRSISSVESRIYLFSYSINQNSLLPRIDRKFILNKIPRGFILRSLLKGVSELDFNSAHCPDSLFSGQFIPTGEDLLSAGLEDPVWRQLFIYKGLNYFEISRPALLAIAAQTLPDLSRYVIRVRYYLLHLRVGTVVLNDNLDEYNRAVIAACRSIGVHSIFVDHGLMGLKHSSLACVRAEPDLVITAGKFDPYDHKSMTLALGNPSLDCYAQRNLRSLKSIRRVLFLSFEDNFYARLDRFAFQEKYFEEIFSIFSTLQDAGIKILYKHHPSENHSYHEYLFNFFQIDTSQIEFVHQYSFSDLVGKVDLVVSNVSACFFEAQAAGVPTIFMDPAYVADAFCPPLNGEKGRDVLRVTSGRELLALIISNQEDPQPLFNFLENFLREQGTQYLGLIDGQASERIINEVAQRNKNYELRVQNKIN